MRPLHQVISICILFVFTVTVNAPLPAAADAPHHAILKRIQSDPTMGPHDISVHYVFGVATLSGRVSSQRDRQRAEELARTLPVVKNVRNGLVVEGITAPYPSDPQLAESVKSALLPHLSGTKFKLQVETNGSTVILNGQVNSTQTRDLLDSVARTTPGVTKVDNRLLISGPANDQELAASVRNALLRSGAMSYGNQINVMARNGVVTLSGDRNNFREIDRALATVQMVSGVKSVRSEMTIRGAPYKTGR